MAKGDCGILDINHAYKYVIGLCWELVQVVLRRIYKEIAEVLYLHIFVVDYNGQVKYFTQSKLEENTQKKDFI